MIRFNNSKSFLCRPIWKARATLHPNRDVLFIFTPWPAPAAASATARAETEKVPSAPYRTVIPVMNQGLKLPLLLLGRVRLIRDKVIFIFTQWSE